MTMRLLTISGYPILLRRSIPVLLLASLLQGGCKSTSPTGIDTSASPADLQSCMIRSFPASPKVLRLAVTGDDAMSDRMISALAGNPRFRLVERTQLQRILAEQQLSSSGLTDGEQALKIGSLMPVDLLLTGREESGVLRGRFFDVVTGEVLSAFSCDASLSTESGKNNTVNSYNTINSHNTTITNSNNTNIHIDTLVVTNPGDVTARKCDSVHRPVRERFENLNGQQNLDAAVAAAVRVPFNEECGRIHYDIMRTFQRYKIFPERYTEFLISTVNGIEHPSADSRTSYILSYFAESNDAIEPHEWKTGLDVLRRAKEGSAQSYIHSLINIKRETAPALTRARTILAMAERQEIGRPIAFAPAIVFKAVLDAMKFDRAEKGGPTGRFLDDYAETYAKTPQRAGFYRSTIVMLMNESMVATDADRRSILRALTLFYAHQPEDRDTDRRAYHELAVRYENLINEEKDASRRNGLIAAAAESREAVVIPLCRAPLPDPENGYTRKEMTSFLLRHAVPCAWLPDVDSLIAKMHDGDWDDKETASAYLSQMGTHAKKAEQTALKYLQIKGMSRSDEIRAHCATILGNIGTTDAPSIRALIEAAGDFSNPVKDAAKTALHRLGSKAVPYMVEYLSRSRTVRDTRFRLPLITVLGRLGSDGRPALFVLQQIATTDKESYVAEQARIAIVNINEGRREEP